MKAKPPKAAMIITASAFIITLISFFIIAYPAKINTVAKIKTKDKPRTLCGDTMDSEDYAKIAGGEPIPCLWTKSQSRFKTPNSSHMP